jgi:hypothetical protein
MPSHDVTLVTGVADSNVLTLIRPDGTCRASVNVPGADDPMNPALLFSHRFSLWNALLVARVCAYFAAQCLQWVCGGVPEVICP